MQKIVVATGGIGFQISVKAKVRMAEIEGVEIFCYKEDEGLSREGEVESEMYYNKIDFSEVDDAEGMYHMIDNHIVTTEDLGVRVIQGMCESKVYKDSYWIERDDELLVLMVEELGSAAGHVGVAPKIVEVPDDVKWEVKQIGSDSDVEYVCEAHREWYASRD
jgi:hypothetical protein